MPTTTRVSDGGSSGSGPDRVTITGSNLNPVLQVVAWLLLAFITLVLSFRLFTNIIVKGRMPVSLEDILFLSSFIFAVAESVTMVVPASSILGKDMDQITEGELIGGLKAEYARDILFILSLSMAKLSACQNIFSLSPNGMPRLLSRIIAWIIGSWMVVCILATAFQCGTRGPWMQEESCCLNQHALLTFMCVMSVITDAAMVALPIWLIFPLNMGLKERLNVVQFLSFFAVCVVYFWPFIKSLQGGLERSSDTNMISEYVLSHRSRSSGAKGGSLPLPSRNQRGDRSNYIELTLNSAGSKTQRTHASNTGSALS